MRYSDLNMSEEEGKALPHRKMPATNRCESDDGLRKPTMDIQSSG